jgi:branched-chain amino acid transport system permease protein
MSDYLFYLLLGSGAGAIIAALGLGLVVTYQASGVVNFASGALATWSAYVYADLRRGAYPFPIPGLPDRYHFAEPLGFGWAFALAVLTSVVLGLVAHLCIFRPLRNSPALAKVVASVGLVIVFIALVERRFGDTSSIRVEAILPREPVTLFADVTVPRDGLWLCVVVAVMAIAVWSVSKFTRVGLAVRGAAENERGAVLLGYSPDRLALLGWVASGVLTSIAAILASSQLQLTPMVFSLGFLVPALGSALLGAFSRLGVTVAAGLAIGMVQSTFTKLQNDLDWFPDYGARDGLPFVIIIVTMMVFGERLPERGAASVGSLPHVPHSRPTFVGSAVPIGIGIVGMCFLGPLWRGAFLSTAIAVVIALSFVVLTGFGGQASLGHMAFAGIGGFVLSRLATDYGIPFPVAPLLASLAAMLLGVVVGVPASRVRGTNLAIITLAGGVTVAEFVFKNPNIIGDISTGGAKVPNPALGSWDFGLVFGTKTSRPIFGLFVLAVTVLIAFVVVNIRRSGFGRVLLAVRGNERASAAIGIDVTRVKLLTYAMSSWIAGIGGILIAYRFGSVSELSFGTFASLTAIAFAYLGGISSVSGAVLAGVLTSSGVAFFGIGRIFGQVGEWEVFVGGLFLIIVAVSNPEGIAGGIRTWVDSRRRSRGSGFMPPRLRKIPSAP